MANRSNQDIGLVREIQKVLFNDANFLRNIGKKPAKETGSGWHLHSDTLHFDYRIFNTGKEFTQDLGLD